MQGLLHGKVVAITGAGWRIGRTACLTFARHGARIVASDLDLAGAEAAAAQVQQAGGQAIPFTCDVGDRSGAEALVNAAVEGFGRLDILLNNTGIALRPRSAASSAPTSRTDEVRIGRFYSVSLDGLGNASRAAIRRFGDQGGGGVIVIADLIARLIDYGQVRYDPNNSAVAALTRALALEAAEQGTRVNSFAPAAMSVEPEAGSDAPMDGDDSTPPGNPLGLAVTPQACADAALFLASELSATITGVNLPIDGGLSAAGAQRQ